MEPESHEEDYRRVVQRTGVTRFLPGSAVEIVTELAPRCKPRHALFDFDGTLSLIREGWPEVMVPMMVEVLQATGTGESPEELSRLVYGFVMELTGKQTVYQMIRLAEEVRRRGGVPKEPLAYKQMYHDRLMGRIAGRHDALRSGRARPDDMLVPGSLEILAALQRRGVTLYLASGTDQRYVLQEAQLLGLTPYFGHRIYGAVDDYKRFSKAMVIARILSEHEVPGEALLGFGDGYVEIRNIKQAGGVAVAVASDEAGRSGRPDQWKRERLIGVGADLVVPDFRDHGPLVSYLCGEAEES
jgi:phosphoglycolate phosphatase-like HAD superfamily hydrolase